MRNSLFCNEVDTPLEISSPDISSEANLLVLRFVNTVEVRHDEKNRYKQRKAEGRQGFHRIKKE